MTYLRSCLIIRAGGHTLGSRVGYRQLRCLTTTHRHCKVTYNTKYLRQKRQVSTDGAKKSQVAVVGQVAPTLQPPNGVDIERYDLEQSRRYGKAYPQKNPNPLPSNGKCSRQDSSCFPMSVETLPGSFSYGQFLSGSNYFKSTSDPIGSPSLDMTFLPTFHSCKHNIKELFFPKRPKSAGAACTSAVDVEISSSVSEATFTMGVEKSKSLEELLPTTKIPGDSSADPARKVKREVFLPRTSDPTFFMVSRSSFDTFLELHNFQENNSEGPVGEKNEDISPFPKSEDPLNAPSSSFIIQNDRSSVIINRDLYITNRILEKLKKIEEKPLNSPEPTVKAAEHLAACTGDSMSKMQCNYVTLRDNAESAVAAEQGITLANSPGDHLPRVDSALIDSTSANEVRSDPKPPLSSSISTLTGNSESFLTNIEFGMSSDKLTALESLALKSRKSLYARMKSSSPCILVDGVHVKHTQLQDNAPELQKEISPLTVDIPDQTGTIKDSVDLPSTNSTSQEDGNIGNGCKPETSVSPINLICTSPFSEFDHSETHTINSLGDIGSGKLQSELEDWFIPLGKEIESMLVTLESSKNHQLIPSDCEASNSIFEDVSKAFEANETILQKEDGFNILEGVEMKNVLLNPAGHRPFETGQSRDCTTSAGLPPESKNPHVDVKTETIIKCCRTGDNTDINITEKQRYLDKRLPYPFCTETVLQVYGTNNSLSKATQAVENSKAQIVHLSNANTPNSGMLTPKLQFNHMLSKSHENVKPSKKTVLKIKVIPNPDTSSQSDPKPSHVLQLSEQPTQMSTDVSKLIRRSKFNKPGPKKVRRGDSVMKLRPKKKLNKESSEKIKILTPQDLEKMFPAPLKRQPMEKPRKVTIETKMGKELSIEIEKHSIQNGAIAAHKNRKVGDNIILKPIASKSTDTKVDQSNVSLDQCAKSGQIIKKDINIGLSSRDQNILKSIISHEVEESFIAVTKKADVNPNISKEALKQLTQVTPNHPSHLQPKIKPQDKTRPIEKSTRPKSPVLPTKIDSSSPKKLDQAKQNDRKKVYASIMGGTKEKPVASVPGAKTLKVENPTPPSNREYVIIEKGQTKATPETQGNASQIGDRKKIDDVLPPSVSTIIANVMRNSGDAQSESRWAHLDKETVPDVKSNNVPMKSTNVHQRPTSAKSGAKPKIWQTKMKPDVKNESATTSVNKQKQDVQESIRTMNAKEYDLFKDKKVWNHSSEPLFFPFETPNYKEMLQDPPQKPQRIQSIPHDPIPKSLAEAEVVYEADFCKLCTENVPGLVYSVPARYQVPLDRMKKFPLVNPGKAKSYSVPSSGAMSINPLHDLMLRRNLAQVPAVTKVLGATLSAKSQQALDRWKEGLISTLGEQGFQEFYQSQLKRGTDFHSAVKKLLVSHQPSDSQDDLCMRSLSTVLGSVSEVSVVESQVVHPLLGYRGVIDCVAKYKGNPVVIEWKRSDKSKPSLKHTYDAPLQLCAYFGAMNFDSNYKAQAVEGGIVVVAYSDGSPADVYELRVEECERHWAKWLKRLHQYYSNLTSA